MITKKPKILFLDDEQNVLDGIKRQIHRELKDWDAMFVSDSVKARDQIMKENFDVVVSDIRMPKLDGLQLLEEIKLNTGFKSPEFIIVTGEGDKELKKKALNLDATDLLNKPVQKEELLARINNAVRLKKARDEILEKNKMLESQLIQSQKMEIIGMMAAGVAHDFNNVLTVIVGSLELAQLKYSGNSNFINEIKKIQKVSGHGQQITSQILKFVKKKDFNLEPVSLNKLIDEALNVMKPALPNGVQISWDSEDEEVSINADYTQVFQIIMNLCLNASRAMDGSGKIKIQLSSEEVIKPVYFLGQKMKSGRYICIKISDNGPGMEKVFVREILANPLSIKQSKSGTGLGLTIVTHCVKNHSGFLTIESVLKQGATFGIYFPQF